jgi:hypothetical protein
VRNNLDHAFWETGKLTKLPIAVQTTFSRPMMSNQKSCFTVHGRKEGDFESLLESTPLVDEGYFKKYVIPSGCCSKIEKELDLYGITYSVVFPDLRGLALELDQRFRMDR